VLTLARPLTISWWGDGCDRRGAPLLARVGCYRPCSAVSGCRTRAVGVNVSGRTRSRSWRWRGGAAAGVGELAVVGER